MTVTEASESSPTTCALEGCAVPIVRARAGGGRPRLYCSDAHRSEARRRRLGGGRSGPGDPGEPLDEARRLLAAAMAALEEAPRVPAYDTVLADARAQATAELLRAQQVAADAVRRAALTEELAGVERERWASERRLLESDRTAERERADELAGALEGARAALEAELLRHHEDVQSLEAALETHRAVHAAERTSWETELGECRRRLDETQARAQRAEASLADADARVAMRTMEAETSGRTAAEAQSRAQELQGALARLERDLDAERRQRRALLAELGRHLGAEPRRTPAGSSRRGRTRLRPTRQTG